MGAQAEKLKSPYQQAIERVLERISDSGLPWPAKPKNYGEEYSFPSDPTTLTSTAVGELYARLSYWHGYAVRLLAVADMSADMLQGRFDLALNLKMAQLEEEGGRGLKDILRARAIASDPTLQAAAYALIEKAAYAKMLKAQASIYDQQAKAVSRELSRRSDDIRIRQGGMG
jgi:hypothetical protein